MTDGAPFPSSIGRDLKEIYQMKDHKQLSQNMKKNNQVPAIPKQPKIPKQPEIPKQPNNTPSNKPPVQESVDNNSSENNNSTEGFSTGTLKNQWSDIMIQHSVYAAVVFLIVSHPETFKFVDNGLKKLGIPSLDKNVLLLVHAVVFALLMYFGTTMVFDPFVSQVGQIVSGFTNNKNKNKNTAKKSNQRSVPRPVKS